MKVSRRSWLRFMAAGTGGLALGGLVDVGRVRAATQQMKLHGTKEFTTACNFCSCGCGMVASVRDGELVNLEGDPDHVISQGGLCSKGSAMFATHGSDQRAKTPLYRAPGSDRWQPITWDDAIGRVAKKIKETRDATWIATEKDGDVEYRVNRTDAIGFLGGAQHTNEECYLIAKMGRLLGTACIEHQARL